MTDTTSSPSPWTSFAETVLGVTLAPWQRAQFDAIGRLAIERARRRAAFALLVLAQEFDSAAERAFTIADVDQRQHEADQTRMLAGAVASGDADPSVADAWLYSCRRILERHALADAERMHS